MHPFPFCNREFCLSDGDRCIDLSLLGQGAAKGCGLLGLEMVLEHLMQGGRTDDTTKERVFGVVNFDVDAE